MPVVARDRARVFAEPLAPVVHRRQCAHDVLGPPQRDRRQRGRKDQRPHPVDQQVACQRVRDDEGSLRRYGFAERRDADVAGVLDAFLSGQSPAAGAIGAECVRLVHI